MNLIEKIGGYYSAKEYLENLNKIPLHEQTEDTITWLPDALLEYRRENNIFEVGDLVVYVDDFMHDEINTVSSVDERIWLNDNDSVCVFEMIRHATPEEIKAGHRL